MNKLLRVTAIAGMEAGMPAKEFEKFKKDYEKLEKKLGKGV